MALKLLILFGACFTLNFCKTIKNQSEPRKFPDGFLFGSSTASYQIEGAWNEDGKSENIWDHLTHLDPSPIRDGSTGDIADDSYRQYKRDVEMMRELGLDFHRFSLSWTRLLPTSFPDKINDAGVDYYNNLINEMLKYNIEPMVTLFHWDLPQKLQEMGGWTNPFIVDWFADYARVVYGLFGDRVKYWITMNEPREICYQGYGGASMAPLLDFSGYADYMCAKNLLLAHAKAYRIYDEEFRSKHGGTIGITLSSNWYEPGSEDHVVAAEDAMAFETGLYAHPIFSDEGDFPPVMKERVASKSVAQGFARSRLPELTPEEVAYIRGTSDFFGLNHYTTQITYRNESVYGYYKSPSFYDDFDVRYYTKSEWKLGESDFVMANPEGFYKLLKYISNKYNNPIVFVTESGFATSQGLEDNDRVQYYVSYLDAMLDAIEEGCNVKVYTAWSIMNNFEWMHGYTAVSFHVTLSGCEPTTSGLRPFPPGFLFGASTAAYQVEGAWNEDGKSESIWDHLTHTQPCTIIEDCSNGDIADDSYHQYKRDVEIMRELGLDFYRFSLSWTRILPTSFPDKVNDAGVKHYNNLIDEMLKYNIQPIVTLYHWDLPQKLQEMGGWTNPNIADWLGDYARTAFELFGDRVKTWITINEPYQICNSGYGDDKLAPLTNISGVADYMCAKNLLMAHARVYHIYDEDFRPIQNGTIFITFSAQWYEPDSKDDESAADEANQFMWNLYIHPIFASEGDYPLVVTTKIAVKSFEQGFQRSRLPDFTLEEIDYVRGSSDILGLNHYTTLYAYRNKSVVEYYSIPSFLDDMNVRTYQNSSWKIGESEFTKFVPWGFYKLLTYLREEYDNPPIFITENGFATYGGLQDEDRITYYRGYLGALLDAVEEGSDVRAYSTWSLLDNFEWLNGYTERFGLYEVDYSDPLRQRTPRKSAFTQHKHKQILRTRALDLDYQPDTTVMAIDDGH